MLFYEKEQHKEGQAEVVHRPEYRNLIYVLCFEDLALFFLSELEGLQQFSLLCPGWKTDFMRVNCRPLENHFTRLWSLPGQADFFSFIWRGWGGDGGESGEGQQIGIPTSGCFCSSALGFLSLTSRIWDEWKQTRFYIELCPV